MKENRDTFFARLGRLPASTLLSADDIVRIRAAYIFAKYGHRAQTRKKRGPGGRRVRYFEHPRGVVLIIMDELGLYDAILIMGGLTHDCVEDTDEIDRPLLKLVCGREVEQMVSLVSKTRGRKRRYVADLWAYADWRVLFLKGCDRLHNLRDIVLCDEAFQRKQIGETRKKYLPLFKRMIEITPLEHRHRSQKLHDLIEEIVIRYERRFARSDRRTD